ncbi:MAG: Yip1 family protein [Pseudomonadota bacterium]|nr:Yip1 family protein [Pseudomonadota bacterium]
MLKHLIGVFTNPKKEWEVVRDAKCTLLECYVKHILLLAAIPPVCAYIGATQVGWSIGANTFRLTPASTLPMAIGFYLFSLLAIYIMGRAIEWMADTFETKVTLDKSVLIATQMVTPLFISGIIALYPVPWLIMLVGMAAMGYTVYLMYTGIPIVLEIEPEKGFILASGVLTVGLVTMVGVMATTVILWGMGFGPQYA